jgi:chromosome segregation ATPase
MANAMAGAKWMTYAELGELIGGTSEAGRQLALRLKLRKQVGNEDKRVRVWVDEETVTRRSSRSTPAQTPVEHPVQTPVQQDAQTGEINALREYLTTVERLMAEQRADHHVALDLLRAAHLAELERIAADQTRQIGERAQLQDQLQEALAEADHAKSDQVRMARDVATMFDELRALADKHAELHADRARLQAGLERLQDERNSAVLSADQAQQEIKRQRDQANALLSQVEDLNGSLDQMRRERQAEVGRLRAELKQERIRWWHRWLRRS